MESQLFAIGKLKQKYLIFDVINLSSHTFESLLEFISRVNHTYRKTIVANYGILKNNYKTEKKSSKSIHITFSNRNMQPSPYNEFYFLCDHTRYNPLSATVYTQVNLKILFQYKLEHPRIKFDNLRLMIGAENITLEHIQSQIIKEQLLIIAPNVVEISCTAFDLI